MKKNLFYLTVLVFLITFSSNILASGGEEVFQRLRCSACHHQEESGFAPSIKEISKFYKDKKDKLIKYLKGEAKAIIDPDREEYMKPYLNQTKKLEDKDLENLAKYLLSF